MRESVQAVDSLIKNVFGEIPQSNNPKRIKFNSQSSDSWYLPGDTFLCRSTEDESVAATEGVERT